MKGWIKTMLPFFLLAGMYHNGYAQLLDEKTTFTLADTLRGTITPERAWWDVTHYDLDVSFNMNKKSIEGVNTIAFTALSSGDMMQIDLMEPMKIESISFEGKSVPFKKDGSVYILHFKRMFEAGERASIEIAYNGTPQIAKNPPWDGGFIWKTDANGKPWVSVACQGLGASVWYPNKDQQGDEPDSAKMHITIPKELVAISNGGFVGREMHADGTVSYVWKVVNPINNYNFVFYIGDYVRYNETYQGEKGPLDVDLWFLSSDMDKAKEHVLPEVRRMLEAFEYWFGPYPFYADGYKIVEAPHLGMEHQSAIAYGNNFKFGYLGYDLSGTGAGQKWDYIVVHESGHEWFANNISTKDIADMWVHEGITSYSEVLFTEYFYGKKEADAYLQGLRNGIENKSTVIGTYGVNQEGSGDMYPKGAALMHTIRQLMDDDVKFRKMMRGMNADFYHQTVTSAEIEQYISKAAGVDLSKVFDQYLRTIKIPELQYNIVSNKKGDFLVYKWNNVVPGFQMPVRVRIKSNTVWIRPSEIPSRLQIPGADAIDEQNFADPNFYITVTKTDLQ